MRNVHRKFFRLLLLKNWLAFDFTIPLVFNILVIIFSYKFSVHKPTDWCIIYMLLNVIVFLTSYFHYLVQNVFSIEFYPKKIKSRYHLLVVEKNDGNFFIKQIFHMLARMPRESFQRNAVINNLNLKLIQLILASCALGFKYQKIHYYTKGGYYTYNEAKQHFLVDDLLICVTFMGYLYLLSIFCIAAISGQIPKGNYVKFFQILGIAAYAVSEFLLRAAVWTTIPIMGAVITFILIVLLFLDCFNIL